MISETLNTDCMELMKGLPDKAFDLAVVDPPYGIRDAGGATGGAGKLRGRAFNNGKIDQWDKAPTQEYFNELFRVSRNQVIWGGNYFNLPPTRCFVCWDKMQPWENFSQVEYAWTSFSSPSKIFRFDNRTGDKIHPTQKPVELYAFIFRNFAKPGDSILDTHLGSGSSRIAAFKMGFDFTGCEIDSDYFNKQQERFHAECLGETFLPNGKTLIQTTLNF